MRIVDLRHEPPPPAWGVTVDADAVDRLADAWATRPFPQPAFDYPGLPPWTGDAWLDFAVVATSVVACLWPPDGEEMWGVTWEGEHLVDAPAVWACFARGLRPADGGLDLGPLSRMDDAAARRFFAGDGVLQLVPERGARLRRVAASLGEHWGGHARAIFEQAGFRGPDVVRLLVETIPGYRDEAETPVGLLRFWKLAHLAVAVAAARSPVPVTGMEEFPVYPDYMLPVVLRHEGVLVYGPELAATVDRRALIPADSNQEWAIRWATVYAGEALRQALGARGNPVTGPALDYALWSRAVLGPDAGRMGEHHRTVTLAY